MTLIERAAGWRQELRALARALAEVGVPAEVIVDDVRAGIAGAVDAHARSGR